MKIVALCALATGLLAAIAGIIAVIRRSVRSRSTGKTAVFLIIACGVFILVAALNLYLVIRFH